MRKNTKYYLSSLESVRFNETRECELQKKIVLLSGKEAAFVSVYPRIIGQPFGCLDIEYVLLLNRHEEYGLFPIRQYPCFVHIARYLPGGYCKPNVIDVNQIENIGWGEIYRTKIDADNHTFDETP